MILNFWPEPDCLFESASTSCVSRSPGELIDYFVLISCLFFRGQRLAEQMQTQNPDLVEQLRRQMGPGPGDNNDPPPPSSN